MLLLYLEKYSQCNIVLAGRAVVFKNDGCRFQPSHDDLAVIPWIKGRAPTSQRNTAANCVFFRQQRRFHCHLNVLEQRPRKRLSPGQTSKPDPESSLHRLGPPARRPKVTHIHPEVWHSVVLPGELRAHRLGLLLPSDTCPHPCLLQGENKMFTDTLKSQATNRKGEGLLRPARTDVSLAHQRRMHHCRGGRPITGRKAIDCGSAVMAVVTASQSYVFWRVGC